MVKMNCWEYFRCGRQPEGKNVHDFGVCPASSDHHANGINFGKNGGRACWAIDGTLCNGAIRKSFAKKIPNCIHCPFYILVSGQEGVHFVSALEVREIISSKKVARRKSMS